MRELLYHAYLRYPRAFYDRHATGQVLSRATNDLYPIRYFIGWGVVQGAQSLLMIVGAGDRARARQRAARALRGGRDAADHGARAALRAAGVADLAPGAGAQGRRHRGGRRGGRRDRDGAGVRPRGRRPRPLRRARRGRPRHRARAGRRRGAPPPGPLLPAVALDRRGRLLRRTPGDRRPPLDRPVRAVRDAAAPARLAAGGARLDHQPRAARARLGRPQLRLARGDRAAAGAGEPAAAARRAARRSASRRCASPTTDEHDVLRDVDLALAPGEIVAVCGADRLGQDDAAEPAAALLRRDGRARAHRRRRHARARDRRAARVGRRSSRSARCCSRSRCGRTSPPAAWTPTGTRCSRPARRRASTRSWTSCRTATTR